MGNYTKTEVRSLAKKFGLPVADKPGSQEICFLPDNDYRSFLKKRFPDKIKPGEILDSKGNLLGLHKGIAFYTIGQREGLGIAKGYPIYIIKLDPEKNQITVGKKEDVYSRILLVRNPTFVSEPIKKKIVCRVKIRYNHKEALASVEPQKNKIKITFRKAQFAVTAGQSAVFYDKDKVLGGGLIERVLD